MLPLAAWAVGAVLSPEPLLQCPGAAPTTTTSKNHDANPGKPPCTKLLPRASVAEPADANLPCACSQTFQEIIDIIKSQSSIKGIRLRVKATFFGVSWAASQQQATFAGIVDRWHSAEHKVLMIKWEGWERCRQAELSALEKDSDGESVELELLPYDDGRPAPTLVEQDDDDDEPPPVGEFDDTPGSDMEDVDEWFEAAVANQVKPLGINSLRWKKEVPEGIKEDARGRATASSRR